MDFSTINLDKLRYLPVAVLKNGCHVSDSLGMGCAGDPPGYPSYFLRSVYNSRGDTPRTGPTVVITHLGTHFVVAKADDPPERVKDVCYGLWVPPAYDSPRTQAWIADTYRHHAHCYCDDSGLVTDKNDYGRFIFPVPKYKLRTFVDDERFSDAWRKAETRAVNEYNRDVIARCKALATPENHEAHRRIVRFYPEAQPRLDYIETPPTEITCWWETDAERPSPETCVPRQGNWKHPINGTWCQWCGWKEGT